jgi:FkbM family methyltransferase
VHAGGYAIRINDVANFRISYTDIFERGIYTFTPTRDDPLILDCGANIGLATLFFKRLAPKSRVVAFEPDAEIFGVLEENVCRNALDDVTLVRGALAATRGSAPFTAGRRYDGSLVEPDDRERGSTVEVETVPLGEYLHEPVDFLKMNVEGAEHEVLESAAPELRSVRELTLEYHHLPERPRTLHRILALLDEAGFDYLVSDLGPRTNPACSPPFRLEDDTTYFLLVHARRRD